MRIFQTSALLAAAFVGLSVGSASAQDTVIAKVPFPFVVRGEEFPAGRYDIINDGHNLAIRGMDNGMGVFALTLPADGRDPAGDQPALVFTHYENKYLLSQIWESSTDGLALPERSAVGRRGEAQPVGPDAQIVLAASLK